MIQVIVSIVISHLVFHSNEVGMPYIVITIIIMTVVGMSKRSVITIANYDFLLKEATFSCK